MSNDPYAALRKSVAEATDGLWEVSEELESLHGGYEDCVATKAQPNGFSNVICSANWREFGEDGTHENAPNNLAFIAAADPPTIRSLLEERDRLAAQLRSTANVLGECYTACVTRNKELCESAARSIEALND